MVKKCLYGLLVVCSLCLFSSVYCAPPLVQIQKMAVIDRGNMDNIEILEVMNHVNVSANAAIEIYKISEESYGYCGRCGWAKNSRGCTNPNCNGYGPRRD